MWHGRFWLTIPVILVTGLGVWSVAQPPKKPAPAPAEEPDEPSAEEARDKAVAERFRKVLETNPRRGTALDKLYGYHVERGTLDKLIAEYAGRAKANPKDGVAWAVVGLLESQRGRDAAAVAAFKQAVVALPDNPIPAYYLGQSLVLVGQPDAAAEAFEQALTRNPNRNDLLDIFQSLGRVYQRAQRTDKALDVWARLEKLFPADPRVQEQIATTLVEEGQFEQALPRLLKLAESTEDKYRQSAFRMDAADLKVRLKKTTEALADFEKLLAELNPDSWLYRDVRRRIEDVFLRNDDLAGLARYYEAWLAKNPADVDAIARLAKTLASQGRAPDARQWLEKGIAVAPSNRGLRQALIEQYLAEQNFTAAIAQYETVDKADPNNPDTLREWGKLIMRDPARPEAERQAAAAAIWKRMLAKKPNDPVITSQVADLLRSAGATDEAVALYRKSIQLAPTQAQYREYLGEYLHSLKRSAEAIETWRPIAEGANRTSKNLARLAEVFAGFGYRKEAIGALADAISLEKDDFGLLMSYADLLHQDGQYPAALEQIEAASRLTSNPEEVEQVLIAQIKVFQANETLGAKIDELKKGLDAGQTPTAEVWMRLARYFEANRQADQATESIRVAVGKDPKSIPVMIAAARIYENGGDLLAAADANRKLAILDRRFRTEYLTTVAKLEQRLGRRAQAIQAGRDLLAASPGNPEVYKFFADLCFQLGDQEEGLEALRRSVRANPSDPQGLITLANALGERLRQGEAIELMWRAFEKTTELDGKLGIIDRITQLYLENNQFDRLLDRLERERRDSDKAREMTLCIAQAYSTAGDLGTARQQLERLLTENTRDSHLLTQLVTICESEGDLIAAVKYQRQLVAAAPSNTDHPLRLAQLLTRTGEADEAADIWVRLVAGDTEPHRNLSAIDNLLTAGKTEAASAILTRMLAQKPGNWELLYREGAALAARGKKNEAAVRFTALLALGAQDDELGEIPKNLLKQAKKKATALPKPGQSAPSPTLASRFEDSSEAPLTRRIQAAYQVRTAVGMEARNYYGGGPQPFYAPGDFGEARMACFGWLYEFARAGEASEGYVKQLREARNKAGADSRTLWDWYYFQIVRNEGNKDLLPTTLTLSKGTNPAGLLAYVNAINVRPQSGANQRAYRRGGGDPEKDPTPPLPPDQLAHLLTCFQKLKQLKPEWLANGHVTAVVMTELKRAKRVDEETALYREMIQAAVTPPTIRSALAVAATRDDLEVAIELFTRLDRIQGVPKNAAQVAQLPTRLVGGAIEGLMGKRAEQKKFADVLRLADLFLATARRQNLIAPRTASAPRRGLGSQMNLYFGNVKGVPPSVALTFPTGNEYYDDHTISVLYLAHLLFKNADLSSDLFAHYRKLADAAKGGEQLYLRLAIGYLYWWADEKEEALTQLTDAARSAPTDYGLTLEVAALREQANEPEVALALLDSINPPDTQTMIRREEAALRLAERTGNLDRARQAADRMFGLRLDADKQLELAGKLHRLGMPQLAEAVLGRAQRQAGNKTSTLIALMFQYQNQSQTELAVQIARQVLSRTPAVTSPGPRRSNENEHYRNQAIGVLARSGQLKEIIERAEAQLKATPRSVQIHQALAGYYQAAGEKKKLKEVLLKTTELKPEDGKLRFQVAQQLHSLGERDAAIAQYKVALKLDPAQFGQQYWQVLQVFSQANKLEELGQLFEEIDLRKIAYPWSVMEPITTLLQSDKGRELGLKVFKKAWAAFPQYRGQLLGQLDDDSVWRLPEIYLYAKEAVVPQSDAEPDPWQGMEDIVSYGSEGRLEGVITRLLSVARKQQRLPELRTEVEASLTKHPEWTGGKALLAVINVQLGDKERGRKLWAEAFASGKGDVPGLARFLLTQELEFYSGMEEVAVATLEAGIDEMMREANYDFNNNPGRRLVWWYEQLGRKDDARKLTLRFATTEQIDPGYSGGYWQYRQIQYKFTIAQELQRTGDTVEAIRLYNQILADRDVLAQGAQYGGAQFEQMIETQLRTALKATRPEALAVAVGALLTPLPDAGPGKPVLDLVMLIESHDLAKAAVTSVFGSAIKATDKAPEVRKDARVKLDDLLKRHPTDISVRTAAVLNTFVDGNATEARKAVDQLVELAEKTPLEALPAGGKANARQRNEARLQLPIWLVARECLTKGRDEYQPAGQKLAARALEAAHRQQDPVWAITILREWGQFDLDRGDRAAAEAKWIQLLELALPKPKPIKATGVPGKTSAPVAPATPALPSSTTPMSAAPRGSAFVSFTTQQPPVAAPPAGSPTPPKTTRKATLAPTTNQFRQAFELAKLTADLGSPEVSLRAIREALDGGPPITDPRLRRGGGPLRSVTFNGNQYLVSMEESNRTVTVDGALAILVPKWRERKVSPGDIYAVLVAAVLPDSRPAEVFLYADGGQTVSTYKMVGGSWTPTTDVIPGETGDERGLKELLIDTAVEAGKADDLRTRLLSRAAQPLGELPAKALLAQLALRTADPARAQEALKAIGERIKTDATQITNDQVASVLVPVLTDPTYGPTIVPYLVKAAENFAAGNNTSRAVETRFKLAAYHLRRKDEAAARAEYKLIEALGGKVTPGSYDVHQPLAHEFLKIGWTEEALRELGAHADQSSAGEPPDPELAAHRTEPTFEEFPLLVRQLLALPADKRYAALKAWSFPTAGRKSIRYYVGMTPQDVPPKALAPAVRLSPDRVVNTLVLLAEAAKETGRVDELLAESEKFVTEKIENAELFRALAYLATGRGKQAEPAIRGFSEAARTRLTAKPSAERITSRYDRDETEREPPIHLSEYLFATLCLLEPTLATHGEGLLGPMLARAGGYGDIALKARLRADQDALVASRAGEPSAFALGVPPRWHLTPSRATWFAQDGYTVSASSDRDAFLLFDTPLAGTFEFSVDAYQGDNAAGGLGYGGVVFEPLSRRGRAQIWPVGRREQVARPADGLQYDKFNRLTVQVSPAKVRCLINGKLLYEDTDPPPTSPWVTFAAVLGQRPVFRNFTLSGNPVVPAEVRLSAGDYLDGWMTQVYSGLLPNRLLPKEPEVPEPNYRRSRAVRADPSDRKPEYDWQAKDGEILGRRLDRAGERVVPSSLAYFRPLRSGESVRYEFFYEPGKVLVHPSLGRLAFLLEPEGVRLHWMTDLTENDWTGLAAENATDDLTGRKGEKLLLKPGDWNTMTLTAAADRVTIGLNGAVVYDAELPSEVERTFGLFHYRNKTAARARNVVLTGPWPKAVGPAAELALSPPPGIPGAKVRRSQLGERYYATEAGAIVARAKGLPPAERYKLLADWVLPTETRSMFQLAGDTHPLDVSRATDAKDQPTGRRLLLGSRFEAPCLELVAAAREAGLLDDLADRVQKAAAPAADDRFARSKLALLAVIRAAQGRDTDSAAALSGLIPYAEKMSLHAGPAERWPDLIAILGTLDRPALAKPALALAVVMNKNLDQGMVHLVPFDEKDWWFQAGRAARARAEVAAQPDDMRRVFGSDPGLAHWAPVAGVVASSRALGSGVPHWAIEKGAVIHRPGHGADYLILRTPLLGDFEVTCELLVQAWQEAHVGYGGYQFELDHDRKKYRAHNTLRHEARPLTITPPLPPAKGNAYQFKLTVKDGWSRVSIDGREVLAERIGTAPDPWLMLHCSQPHTGEVRGLTITGRPSIPDKIDLLASADLGMWRSYLGRIANSDIQNGRGNSWMKRGEELFEFGMKPEPPPEGKPLPPRGFPESAIYYQRPFLEDGAVEYEFFHDPDKAHVHPALDRLVFLLEPDGVQLHRLTDGASDQTGIAVDNAVTEPDRRRGPTKLPLKPKSWNTVRLEVKGDTVHVWLNGVEVYERPIESINQRTFGLFHYTDRTEARVRSLSLTGDWPKQLPAADRLFETKK